MIEHVGRHLPVCKVQLIDESTKFRILHRNLLFFLATRNESDEKQQIMEENGPKLTDSEEENETPCVEQIENYDGPITRSKTKRMENAWLLKANTLMSNHFNNQ